VLIIHSTTFYYLLQEKDASARLLQSLTQLVENIFTSVFIHRHKDFHEDVRAHCAANLGDWVTTRFSSHMHR